MPITFFDVETPNRRHDRICSVGVIRLDDTNNVEYSNYTLIDPEVPFDRANTEIHGITAKDVYGCQNFASFWDDELRYVFADSIIIAHNAAFDLQVLDKTLSYYSKSFDPMKYICTKRAAERSGVDFPSYKLPDLCDSFDVSLDLHHHALSDAKACMNLFNKMLAAGLIDLSNTSLYIHTPYDSECSLIHGENVASAMTELYGTALGISIDKKILPEENTALIDWANKYGPYKTHPIFNEIYSLLDAILADGVVTMKEKDSLINFTRPFVLDNQHSRATVAMQELLGLIRGVGADRKVNEEEANGLLNWINEHSELKNDKLCMSIFEQLTKTLHDGVITPEEEIELLAVFDKLTSPTEQSNDGIIELSGKRICLTGEFSLGPKNNVSKYIEEHGGIIIKSVTKQCDYVIVGDRGNDQYAFGNYGTKVKKAMDYQNQGLPIRIIHEVDIIA